MIQDVASWLKSATKGAFLPRRESSTDRILYDPPLDTGIQDAVETLQRAGVETFESCQGGLHHAYPEPTVRFHGDASEGLRALSIALKAGLPVAALRRSWPVIDKEPTGPWWELTFYERAS